MFVEKLRSETKDIHLALEKAMIPGLKQATTFEAYSQILQVFYGFFQGMETLLDTQLSADAVPAYNQRRKATVILEDLKSIGHQHVLPIVATNLPHITNQHEALGAMYVLEGSTLGGRVITKMLMQNLNLANTEHVKFFSGYGEETDKMWGSFMGVLNRYAEDESKQAEMIKAAMDTFAKFKLWIEQHPSI